MIVAASPAQYGRDKQLADVGGLAIRPAGPNMAAIDCPQIDLGSRSRLSVPSYQTRERDSTRYHNGDHDGQKGFDEIDITTATRTDWKHGDDFEITHEVATLLHHMIDADFIGNNISLPYMEGHAAAILWI